MKKFLSKLLILGLLSGLLSGCGSGEAVPDADTFRVALILEDPGEARWAALTAGAMEAAAALALEVADCSAAEGGSEAQAARIRQAAEAGYDVIVASWEGSGQAADALQEAGEAGIRVILVDAPWEQAGQTALGTDHNALGRQAGEFLLSALEEQGVTTGILGVMGVDDADAASSQREAGFLAAVQGKGFAIAKTLYDEKDPALAQSNAADYIRRDVVGIFAASATAAQAAGEAVREEGARTLVVGYGQSDPVMELLEGGEVRAVLTQDYEAMGRRAMEMAAAIQAGQLPEQDFTDTGFTLTASQTPFVHPSYLRVALIFTDRFQRQWSSLEEGAAQAAAELGCRVDNLSPMLENEARQAEQIRQAVAEGYDVILSASCQSVAVAEALEEAREAGVNVICVDAEGHTQFDGALPEDNQAQGALCAQALLAQLEAQEIAEGNILLIGSDEEDEAALGREAGFRAAMEGTGYTLLDTVYSGGDAAQAHTITVNHVYKKIKAIVCFTEAAAIGAGNGVKERRVSLPVVGWGSSEPVLSLLEEGFLQAVIQPRPEALGYDGVMAALDLYMGWEARKPESARAVVATAQEE